MLEQPAIELMSLAIELEPVNAVTGFIERLKENDVCQMSSFRKFLPKKPNNTSMVADKIAQIESQRNDMQNKTSSCIKEEWK